MYYSSDLEDVTNIIVDEVLEGKSYYEAYEDVEDDLQTAIVSLATYVTNEDITILDYAEIL